MKTRSLSVLLAMALPTLALFACGDDSDDSGGAGGKGSVAGSAGSNAQGGEDSGGSSSGGSSTGGSEGGSEAGAGASSGSGAQGGAESGEAGAGGAGGAPEQSVGQRFVEAFSQVYFSICECLVEGGAYADVYECAAGQGYTLLSNHTADCLDAGVADSEFLSFYVPCATEALAGVNECGAERGCSGILGHATACAEGGTATRCDGTPQCAGDVDEEDCPPNFECDGGELILSPANVCDNLEHCADDADEADCEGKTACSSELSVEECGTPAGDDQDRLQLCMEL